MSRLIQKTLTISLGVLAPTYLPFVLIGIWNRLFGGWQSLFFCYAGNASYGRSYAPPAISILFRWRPSPIAVLSQGGARGLVVASDMTEADFLDPKNAADFVRFQKRLKRVARIMGVEQIHLAGILPSVLRHSDVLTPYASRGLIVDLVAKAASQLVDDRFGGDWPPLIVLGAGGYIGEPLCAALGAREIHRVDPALGSSILPDLGGRPALLIDVARAGKINDYIPQMWPGLVVLNEAFPEPARKSRKRLVASGVELWHLAGAEGSVWPNLPFAYGGAVPCCAVHRPQQASGPVLRLLEVAADGEDTQTCQRPHGLIQQNT